MLVAFDYTYTCQASEKEFCFSVNTLSSPTAVKKAMTEFDQLGRDKFLAKYGFREAREYVVRQDGREYDSKAIVGVAHKYEFPEDGPLLPDKFSGGVGSGGAAKQLHDLGFEVVGMSEHVGWALWECEKTVAAYLQCLEDQSAGKQINKAAVYRRIAAQLQGRTPKSVEYKFQNIEKILEEEDLPRLGMSTKANYQSLLRVVVLDQVAEKPKEASLLPKSLPPVKRWAELVSNPPQGRSQSRETAGSAARAKNKVAYDDALNRALGRAGEEYMLLCEQDRLRRLGRADLAARVVWVAKTDDSLGYDILSYDDQGATQYVEVKTTNAGKATRFFITDNELAAAREYGQSYRLYRLFHFNRDPQLYVLVGPLEDKLHLKAKSYAATCRG